jgi:predicted SnoaL-like aldol condensation-catalyzing enzyme
LYAPNVAYWSEPYREPFEGIDRLREYFAQAFEVEHSIDSWFGEPVVDGDRAAVAWWGTLVEEGKPITLAGISLLRFDADGLVAEQWDGWNQADKMRQRPPDWAF